MQKLTKLQKQDQTDRAHQSWRDFAWGGGRDQSDPRVLFASITAGQLCRGLAVYLGNCHVDAGSDGHQLRTPGDWRRHGHDPGLRHAHESGFSVLSNFLVGDSSDGGARTWVYLLRRKIWREGLAKSYDHGKRGDGGDDRPGENQFFPRRENFRPWRIVECGEF